MIANLGVEIVGGEHASLRGHSSISLLLAGLRYYARPLRPREKERAFLYSTPVFHKPHAALSYSPSIFAGENGRRRRWRPNFCNLCKSVYGRSVELYAYKDSLCKVLTSCRHRRLQSLAITMNAEPQANDECDLAGVNDWNSVNDHSF